MRERISTDMTRFWNHPRKFLTNVPRFFSGNFSKSIEYFSVSLVISVRNCCKENETNQTKHRMNTILFESESDGFLYGNVRADMTETQPQQNSQLKRATFIPQSMSAAKPSSLQHAGPNVQTILTRRFETSVLALIVSREMNPP